VVLAGAIFTLNFWGETDVDPQVLAVAVATISAALLLATWAAGRVARQERREASGPPSSRATRPAPRATQSHPQPAIGRLWRRLAVAAVWAGAVAGIATGIVRPLQANVLCGAGERLLNARPRDAVQAVA